MSINNLTRLNNELIKEGLKICSNENCIHQSNPQSVSNFHKDSRSLSGFQPKCKDCRNSEGLEYAKTEAGKQSRKKWYSGEKGKATQKQYYESRKDPKPPRIKVIEIKDVKICIRDGCVYQGKPQPLDNFHKHSRSVDGRAAWCKDCKKKWDIEYSKTDRAKELSKKYKQSEKGKLQKQRYNQLETTKERNRIKSKLAKEKAETRYKILARNKLNKAIRANKIPHISTQKCTRCSNQANQYHHYLGYDKEHWYDVEPLCYFCHDKLHRET